MGTPCMLTTHNSIEEILELLVLFVILPPSFPQSLFLPFPLSLFLFFSLFIPFFTLPPSLQSFSSNSPLSTPPIPLPVRVDLVCLLFIDVFVHALSLVYAGVACTRAWKQHRSQAPAKEELPLTCDLFNLSFQLQKQNSERTFGLATLSFTFSGQCTPR